MKIKMLLFLSVILTNSFSCSANTSSVNTENNQSTSVNSNKQLNLKVETSPDIYAPIMASTIGILIKPVFKQEDMQNNKIIFKTNQGFFTLWSPQVKNLGKEATYDGNNIYWSYDIADKFSESTINLLVINNKNEIIKNIDIKIKVDDKGFASVVTNL